MRIVNSITERDALTPPPVLCVTKGSGVWTCYDTDDEIPAEFKTAGTPTPSNIIPVSAFRDRFTPPELMGVTSLAYAGDQNMQYLLLKLQTNTDGVDLLSAEVIGGVTYLVGKGVLSAARKAEILA